MFAFPVGICEISSPRISPEFILGYDIYPDLSLDKISILRFFGDLSNRTRYGFVLWHYYSSYYYIQEYYVYSLVNARVF